MCPSHGRQSYECGRVRWDTLVPHTLSVSGVDMSFSGLIFLNGSYEIPRRLWLGGWSFCPGSILLNNSPSGRSVKHAGALQSLQLLGSPWPAGHEYWTYGLCSCRGSQLPPTLSSWQGETQSTFTPDQRLPHGVAGYSGILMSLWFPRSLLGGHVYPGLVRSQGIL